MSKRTRMLWTFAISSIALFMVTLDNLVVTTAIPVIRKDLHASLSSLEWTVNAYTLTFAVLLLTGAALGDRFGRRRVFSAGISIFTLGSVAAALAPNVEILNVARAFQGLGGAIVMPLTLTILSAAVPAEKRGVALGAWGGISGLAVAFGPLVGGAVVQGISWQWIFWLNVPIGLVLVPLALARLDESYGPEGRLDLPGLGLASAGLFGIVWGLVRGNEQGWASTEIVAAIAVGLALVGAFVAWELRAEHPMLPMRFFRNATFSLANAASLFMYFGMFGSIFLLAQFFQTVQGYSPFGSGLRILPWTLAPMFIAPVAGALSDRIPAKNIIGVGLSMQAAALAWIAAVSTPTTPYSHLIAPFIVAGVGMALFFAPVANVVLSAVKPVEEGKASGANNAIRELGGVFGVAVLASIFAHAGGYRTPDTFVNGMTTGVYVGAGVVALGAAAAFAIPRRRRAQEAVAEVTTPVYEAEAA
ncbi:MAG: DHA2 family efflux MFS transporter permease subunit [Actinobacteria bacterium]|nr:MAG: DHA2 family efflux MFS transporter permease subunit [Actinomycetota bacterium]